MSRRLRQFLFSDKKISGWVFYILALPRFFHNFFRLRLTDQAGLCMSHYGRTGGVSIQIIMHPMPVFMNTRSYGGPFWSKLNNFQFRR